MRAAVSETVMSGSLPMSSATTASTIWSLLRLMLRADCRERRRPVTTIVSPVAGASAFCAGWAGLCCAVALGSGGTDWSCATAGEDSAKAAASEVVDHSKVCARRIDCPLLSNTDEQLLCHLYDTAWCPDKLQSRNTNEGKLLDCRE